MYILKRRRIYNTYIRMSHFTGLELILHFKMNVNWNARDLQTQGACRPAIYFQVVSIEQGQFIFYVKIPSQVVSDTFLRPLEP